MCSGNTTDTQKKKRLSHPFKSQLMFSQRQSFSWLRCCFLSQLLKGLRPIEKERVRERGQCGSTEGSKAGGKGGKHMEEKTLKGRELLNASQVTCDVMNN